MEAVKWIEPVIGELGECRVRFVGDHAWSYNWRLVRWNGDKVSVKRPDGERFDDIPVTCVEVADV